MQTAPVSNLIEAISRYSEKPYNGTTAAEEWARLGDIANQIRCISIDEIELVDATIDKSLQKGSFVGVRVVRFLLHSLEELSGPFIQTALDAALADISSAENSTPQTLDLLISRTSFANVAQLLMENLTSDGGLRLRRRYRCILFQLGLLDDLDGKVFTRHRELENALLSALEQGHALDTTLDILRDIMPISHSYYKRLLPKLSEYESPLLISLLTAKGGDLSDFLRHTPALFSTALRELVGRL